MVRQGSLERQIQHIRMNSILLLSTPHHKIELLFFFPFTQVRSRPRLDRSLTNLTPRFYLCRRETIYKLTNTNFKLILILVNSTLIHCYCRSFGFPKKGKVGSFGGRLKKFKHALHGFFLPVGCPWA